MPIIHFTAGDALQTKVIEKGIYPSEVIQIAGPNKSASGKSYSFFVDIQITDGPYKGKTRTVVFNSETNSPSILGEMQFYPQSYMLQLHSAVTGRTVKAENFQLDTDELLHGPFDAAWDVATNEGHIFNVINNFYPKDYGATAPTF
jgi:hypothetical protein